MAVPACRRMRKFARRKVRLRAKSPSCSCRVLTQPPATLSARPRSAQTLRASSVRRNAWAMVTLGAPPWENRGNLHAHSACLFAQCVVDCGSTYLQYALALSPGLAQKCCAAQAHRLLCARDLRFLDLPLAAPCGLASSSALRANIARFFYALRRAGSGLR